MTDISHEASQLGVDPAWLALRMAPVGVGRCPACHPDRDIIVEGNYIQPCDEHSGNRGSLESPDDRRVTAPMVDIAVSGGYV